MTGFQAPPDVLTAMLAKAEEKLKVARKNLEDGFFGDVSSRSYYAVFHAISAVLASKGLTFSSHAQVIGAFNKEFIKTAVFPQETTRKLQRLFEDRQISDYDCLEEIDEETARTDLQDAEELISACRNYLNIR
jgi:uncharacterized protein (UPF0332 family)